MSTGGFLSGYLLRGAMEARKSMHSRAADAMVSNKTARRSDDLEGRLDRTSLVIEAMWSLLEDAGYSRLDLTDRIQEIDGMDGMVDGRSTPQRQPCGSCGAAVAASAPTCQFCGAENPDFHPLQGM